MGFGLSILVDSQVINCVASGARGGEHETEAEARIQGLHLSVAMRLGDQINMGDGLAGTWDCRDQIQQLSMGVSVYSE